MPFFGALCYMPGRLGGSATNGWTAAQHARYCADLVALQRVQPLARWVYTQTGTGPTDAAISSYSGRNGVGLAYAPTPEVVSSGICDFEWPTGDDDSWPDPFTENSQQLVAKAVIATPAIGASNRYATAEVTGPRSVRVRNRTHTGANALNEPVSVTVYGYVDRSHTRAIGDYGGDPNKEDSATEGTAPYAEFILRELASQRGTAYTKQQNTLVDVENLALARFLTACGPKLAEKFRANCVPARSDERLPYWEKFLAVPKRLNEPKWRTRQKLAAHYQLTEGPNIASVRTALEDLLGEAFVDATWEQGSDLANPPTGTYWPTINPGPSSLSLGGGAWTSPRNHLLVEVTRPSNMTEGEFLTLMDVDLFTMLDRMLPATKTFSWFLSDEDGGGFFLDVSPLDFTGLQ